MSSKSNLWIAGACVPIVAGLQARAQDRLSYGHEAYIEKDGRMQVNTDSAQAFVTLSPWATVTLGGVYDSISGATPIGAPPPNKITLFDPVTHERVPSNEIAGFTRSRLDAVSGASPGSAGGSGGAGISETAVPTAQSRDYRTAFNVAAGLNFGNQHLVPQIAYSRESDYISYSGALNYSLDLNDKNTTVNAGWSHADDQVLANNSTFITNDQIKNTDDFILGVTQLLSPKTILSVSGTISYAHGYLSDPYRAVVFDDTPLDSNALLFLYGEKRPTTRNGQSLFVQVTQAVDRFNGSVEGSYRYYHDSYGIQAHTVDLAWFQKIGRYVVVSPSFRYYFQEGASFYATQFPGDPVADPSHVPAFYSADYRLSHFASYTAGIDLTYQVHDGIDLRLGYKRYLMRGLDRTTDQSVYPKADIITGGFDIVF
jgi:hypothetical protein